MKLFAVALMFLTAVILIVSLFYIITITRSKEKLALIEKGLNPKDYMEENLMPRAIKAGLFLVGGGTGFILALLIDEFLLIGIDNPAIYAGCVSLCAGIGLIIFHKTIK